MADDELDDLDILNDVGDPDTAGEQGTGDSEEAETEEESSDEGEVEGDEDEAADEESEEEEPEAEGEEKEGEEKPAEKKGKAVVEGRPSYQELKKADPEIFKKVPGLKDIFFREQKFSEIYASVEEAHTAATKAENYDIIEASLINGDPSLVLGEIAQNAPNSIGNLVDNFLPTVQRLSKDLYVRATMPVLEDLIRLAYEDGKRSNNKNLMYAAGHLAQHVFGTPKIPEPRNINRGPHPAEVQLREERNRHFNERYGSFNSDVASEAYVRCERLATQGINDPENKLNAFTRKAIVAQSLAELDRMLGGDQQLTATMRQLWRRATVGGFTKEHKEALLNAHLSRAKQLLPGIRNRLVAEALGQKVAPGGGKVKQKKVLPEGGRGAAGQGGFKGALNPKKIDWGKTSDADILNNRVTFRK